MGVTRNIILVFLLIASITSCSLAQELPQVHKINGEKYYLHVVQPGNTIYGISKLYNLEIGQIIARNPVVKEEGLKVNQTLLIPVTGDNKKSLGGLIEENKEHILHEVQPKETLYAISKKYNVSLDALLNTNPEIREDGLKAGTTVKIPVAKVRTEKEEFIQSAALDSLQAHIVEKGQTLYAISKLYDVKVDALKRANPGLSTDIKEGIAIRIPGRLVPPPPEKKKDSAIAKKDTIVQHVPDSTREEVRVGLLLPIEPVFPDSNQKNDFQISEAQRVSLSFYRGFMHAIDSLSQKHGVRFRVELLETGQDSGRINFWNRTGRLDSLDIAVGPFYTDQFMLVADHLKQRGVPTICPIPKPSKILFGRPNAIKTTPSESMQLDAIAEFLAANYSDSNLVVINTNKLPDQENIEFFKARFAVAKEVPDTFINDAIREVKLWDIDRDALTMRFPDSGSYTIVLPSNNKVFITKFLSELYNLHYGGKGKYRFRVIGLEDWQKYAGDLDIQQLHALNVTLPINSHLNFDDYRVNNFFQQYRRAHGYEPDRFTLAGFDLGHYLIRQMAFNARGWYQSPEGFPFQGILMNYHFERVIPESGIENQSVELYEYDSFRLKKFATWPPQEMK